MVIYKRVYEGKGIVESRWRIGCALVACLLGGEYGLEVPPLEVGVEGEWDIWEWRKGRVSADGGGVGGRSGFGVEEEGESGAVVWSERREDTGLAGGWRWGWWMGGRSSSHFCNVRKACWKLVYPSRAPPI